MTVFRRRNGQIVFTKKLAVMMRHLLLMIGMCSVLSMLAQTLRFENVGFVEEGAVVQLFVDLPEGGRVQSIYATQEAPMSLSAPDGVFQLPLASGGGFLPGSLPESDSWWTIGLANSSSSINEVGGEAWNAAKVEFEAGGDFVCDGAFGGSVYLLPGSMLGYDDGDGVLLGQFITAGSMDILLNLQWKNVSNETTYSVGLTASLDVAVAGGCTDSMALNYAASVEYDDGSCLYQTSSFAGLEYELVDTAQAVYRLYAMLQNPAEHVVSVYGTADQPLSLASTAGFTQIPGSVEFVGDLEQLTPEALEVDSWLTIGGAPGSNVLNIGMSEAQFAAGGALESDPTFGGSWFLQPGSAQATPDSLGRVLLGQLASAGEANIELNLKYRNADDEPVDLLGLTLDIPALEPLCETDALGICDGTCELDANANGLCDSDELAGCTDMSASNYLPGATLDDGSCDDSGTEAIGFEGLSFTETMSNGQTTYRIYGQFDGAGYEVVAQYGWDEHPYHISTTGQFHQVASAGALASNLTGSAAESDDSWLTIGSDDPDALNLYEVGMNLGSFEDGGGILVNDPIGGAVFNIPGEQPSALSGADGQVLLAQFTIDQGEDLNIQLSLRYLAPAGTVHDALDATLSLPLPILGCTDPAACNTDDGADTDDGSCTYPEPGLDCEGGCLNDADMDGICDEDEVAGCTNSDACNYNPDATDNDDGSCLTADCDGDGICDVFEVEGCMYAAACNYNPQATDDDGSCLFAEPMYDCEGNCLFDPDGDGICNGTEDLGCTYPSAANYDEDASIDDGSCQFPTGACAMDFNQDGEVNVPDLLDFLVKLGELCPLYLE